MRVIRSDSSGVYAYQKIFRHLQASAAKLVIWQTSPDSGQRHVIDSVLNSFHIESNLLHLELSQGISLRNDLPIYCYSKEGMLLFKTSLQELRSNVFSLAFPEEIKLLEELEITQIKDSSGLDLAEPWKAKRLNFDRDRILDFMKVKSMAQRTSRDQEFLKNEFNPTLDEEDKLFADKRESPRARPKMEKLVKFMNEGSEDIHSLRLFDLSQGGLSFLTLEPNKFPKGAIIMVLGFGDFGLDDPIIAEIMSHRSVDDSQVEFKVGCKFHDGQA
jgi:hypothetical protein